MCNFLLIRLKGNANSCYILAFRSKIVKTEPVILCPSIYLAVCYTIISLSVCVALKLNLASRCGKNCKLEKRKKRIIILRAP